MTFDESVAQFQEVAMPELIQKIEANEELAVFIGRATCPYCRRFAPKLAKVATEHQKSILFVNSENPDELDDIQAFRNEHGLKTVPALLVIKNQQVKAVCDSSLSEDAILDFLNQ